MSAYTLPSPLDDIHILCYSPRFFLATGQRPDAAGPCHLPWVIVAPIPVLFGLLQCANKRCFILAGPRGISLVFGTSSFGTIAH